MPTKKAQDNCPQALKHMVNPGCVAGGESRSQLCQDTQAGTGDCQDFMDFRLEVSIPVSASGARSDPSPALTLLIVVEKMAHVKKPSNSWLLHTANNLPRSERENT